MSSTPPTLHPSSVSVIRDEVSKLQDQAADLNKRITDTSIFREMSGWAAELALLVEDVLAADAVSDELRAALREALHLLPEAALRRAIAGARALAELADLLEALDLAGVADKPLVLAVDFEDGQLLPVVRPDLGRWRELVRLGEPPVDLDRATHEEIGGAAAALLDLHPDLVATDEGARLAQALVAGDYRDETE